MNGKDIKVGRFYKHSAPINGYLEFVTHNNKGRVGYTYIYLERPTRESRSSDSVNMYVKSTKPISLIKITLLYGENKAIMNWVDKQIKGNK